MSRSSKNVIILKNVYNILRYFIIMCTMEKLFADALGGNEYDKRILKNGSELNITFFTVTNV